MNVPVTFTAAAWICLAIAEVACFLSLWTFARRQELGFDGEDPAGPDRSDPRSWVCWVDAAFPEKEGEGEGGAGGESEAVFRREDALAELDEWLGRVGPLMILQRLAVSAPLLGVLITAVGLLTLRPEVSREARLADVLLAVSPLFLGVLGGAVLAIASQIFLFFAVRRVDVVRLAARDWFDREVWRPHAAAARVGARGLVPALDGLTSTVGSAAKTFKSTVADLQTASASLRKGATDAQGAFAALARELEPLKGIVSTLSAAATATRASADALQDAAPRAAEQLEQASGRFAEAVLGPFTAAVRQQVEMAEVSSRWAGRVETCVSSLGDSAGAITTGMEAVVGSADAAREASRALAQVIHDVGDSLRRSVSTDLAGSNVELKRAVDAISAASARLAAAVDDGSKPLLARLGEVDGVLGRMNAAAGTFRDLADLRPGLDSLNQTLSAMNEAVNGLRGLASLHENFRQIQRSVEQTAASSQAVAELPERFRDRLGGLTEQLLRRQMEELQDVLRDAIVQLGHLAGNGRAEL